MAEKRDLERLRSDGAVPVARITLDHPPLNMLDRRMLEALDRCLADLERLPGLRCVILSGQGRAFVAGGDLAEYDGLTPEIFREFVALAHGVFRRLELLPVPVIAAINGFAIGGGMELALACDIRLMAREARIVFPETLLGLMPSYGGTARLGKLLSPGDAKYLSFSGRPIGAERALAMGLVQEVCAAEELLPAAEALASDIAARSPAAIRALKGALRACLPLPLDEALALEREAAVRVVAQGDVAEGVAAFSEKRAPVFPDV